MMELERDAGDGDGDGWWRCAVCDQVLPRGRRCDNYWCDRDDRGFDAVFAIAPHAGALRDVVAQFKYRGRPEWAGVLATLVVAFLNGHSPWFEHFQLITSTPSHPSRPALADPAGLVLARAARLAGDLWPFDVGSARCVVKTAPSVPLKDIESPVARRLWAASDLRSMLHVPWPERVRDREVLVFDDVFTDGSTLREVALALRGAGARAVSGLVLARQPWHAMVQYTARSGRGPTTSLDLERRAAGSPH